MRTIDAIAASAGLLACVLLINGNNQVVDTRDAEVLAAETVVLEADMQRAAVWASGAFSRCYDMAENAQPPTGEAEKDRKAQLVIVNACSGGVTAAGLAD